MQEIIEKIVDEAYYHSLIAGEFDKNAFRTDIQEILPVAKIHPSIFKDGAPTDDGEYVVKTEKGYQLVKCMKRHPFILCGDSTYCSFLTPIISHIQLP